MKLSVASLLAGGPQKSRSQCVKAIAATRVTRLGNCLLPRRRGLPSSLGSSGQCSRGIPSGYTGQDCLTSCIRSPAGPGSAATSSSVCSSVLWHQRGELPKPHHRYIGRKQHHGTSGSLAIIPRASMIHDLALRGKSLLGKNFASSLDLEHGMSINNSDSVTCVATPLNNLEVFNTLGAKGPHQTPSASTLIHDF